MDLVFPSPTGAMWRKDNFMARVFRPAVRRAELDGLTFHDLRHSYASLMVASGASPHVIAEQLGHRDARLVLQRYGHLYPGASRQAAIEAVASEGNVVIGSHGASFVLGGRDDLLRVFVTAPAGARARRLAAKRGMDEKEAERQIRAADKSRADYLKRSYDVDREDPTQYDLVVNTDALSPGEAAKIVAHAAG